MDDLSPGEIVSSTRKGTSKVGSLGDVSLGTGAEQLTDADVNLAELNITPLHEGESISDVTFNPTQSLPMEAEPDVQSIGFKWRDMDQPNLPEATEDSTIVSSLVNPNASVRFPRKWSCVRENVRTGAVFNTEFKRALETLQQFSESEQEVRLRRISLAFPSKQTNFFLWFYQHLRDVELHFKAVLCMRYEKIREFINPQWTTISIVQYMLVYRMWTMVYLLTIFSCICGQITTEYYRFHHWSFWLLTFQSIFATLLLFKYTIKGHREDLAEIHVIEISHGVSLPFLCKIFWIIHCISFTSSVASAAHYWIFEYQGAECPHKWTRFNGECFRVIHNNGSNWEDAHLVCKEADGYLLTPLSMDYVNYMSDFLLPDIPFWVNTTCLFSKPNNSSSVVWDESNPLAAEADISGLNSTCQPNDENSHLCYISQSKSLVASRCDKIHHSHICQRESVWLSFYPFHMNVGNLVYIVIDMCISATPMHLLHVFLPLLFISAYAGSVILYMLLPYQVEALDGISDPWSGVTRIYLRLILLALAAHFLLWLSTSIRRFIHTRFSQCHEAGPCMCGKLHFSQTNLEELRKTVGTVLYPTRAGTMTVGQKI